MKLTHGYTTVWTILIAVCASIALLQGAPASQTPRTEASPRDADAAGTSAQWINRTVAGSVSRNVPGAALFVAMLYNPVARRIVLFGGLDEANRDAGELWMLDPEKAAWQKISVAGPRPPTAEDQSTVYDPIGHRMIVYGGETDDPTNNLWSLDLKTYRWRNMTAAGGPVREGHTAVFDESGKQMVVFGGQHELQTDLHEIWSLDLNPESPTFEKWRNQTIGEGHPPGRFDHVAVYDAKKQRMVIFGGWTKTRKQLFGDTWALHLGAQSGRTGWEQVTAASHPPDRRNASAVYDAARNWFVIFGGEGKSGPLSDVWAFDLTNDVWISITPSGAGPAPRADAEALYHPERRSAIIYGGVGGGERKLRDMWELQIQQETAPAPPAQRE
jgi:hypothetical protein